MQEVIRDELEGLASELESSTLQLSQADEERPDAALLWLDCEINAELLCRATLALLATCRSFA